MLIPLSQWAAKHAISPMDARNWARRGFIPIQPKQVTVVRWFIEDIATPPVLPSKQGTAKPK